MKTRKMLPLALAAGCCLPTLGWAKGPWFFNTTPAPAAKTTPAAKPTSRATTTDQSLAEAAAEKIMAGAPLQGCSLEITCTNGVIELTGEVPTEKHSAEIEQRAKTASGIKSVKNVLVVKSKSTMSTSPIVQTSAQIPAPGTLPTPAGLPLGVAPPTTGAYPPGAMPGPMGGPIQTGGADPVPVSGGGPAAYDLNPPRMPAYAWPTYAPYNNYSRVAHPTLYPYSAWPFIGPFYPFPKVPLGWRKITLEWEDGHWFYGKNASCHDYWRIRYW